ncbi:MAG: tetratricopeptide repeat protein [Spirochaetales bacterium]|jgi:tetratricopeptide (TPR) repeat protein|nr:tetratricopeptide repeat protein [Spirochaetales bacterium]
MDGFTRGAGDKKPYRLNRRGRILPRNLKQLELSGGSSEEAREIWEADFAGIYRDRLKKGFLFFKPRRDPLVMRFKEEAGAGYQCALGRDALELTLNKKNIFAWADDPWFRYGDFVLDADCTFRTPGYAALGFSFRRINEGNYYYFLISNRGFFRFDQVFNNNPRIIIPWTPLDPPPAGPNREDSGAPGLDLTLRIIAYGGRFIFIINGRWAGEAEDETAPLGFLAWAAQNYDEADEARLALRRLRVESRPLGVQGAYEEWTGSAASSGERARFNLAGSFYLIGAHTAAIIQLKKLSRLRRLSAEERLLLARAFLGAGLFREALGCVRRYREEFGAPVEILQIEGICLYELNRFLELRDFLIHNAEELSAQEWYHPLLGNGEYALGNYQRAAQAYQRALEILPDSPLVKENLLKAREKLGQTEGGFFLETARLYFLAQDTEKARQNLSQAREAIAAEASPPDREELTLKADILEGKIAFQEERWTEAGEIFKSLADRDAGDSSVYFLYGLLQNRSGRPSQREEGMENLKRAADMETGEFIYQFKTAEALFLGGLDPEPYLSRALAIEKGDPWANNLAGLAALERGRSGEALDYLSLALDREPDSPQIVINYSCALKEEGREQEGRELLLEKALGETREGELKNAGMLYNQLGFLCSANEEFEESSRFYEKALACDPSNRTYRLNAAGALIEADHIHRAEELLLSLGEAEDPEVYNLMGNLARIKGEFYRAEEAYKGALAFEPENPLFLLNLACLYALKQQYPQARALVEKIPPALRGRRGQALLDRIDGAGEIVRRCGACERQWRLPRNPGAQLPLKLRGEIPGDLPAGRCGECGEIFCVDCARPYIREGHFFCPACGGPLKLDEPDFLFLYRRRLDLDEKAED